MRPDPTNAGAPANSRTPAEILAHAMEATVLGPAVDRARVTMTCAAARELGLLAVCVPPAYVSDARRALGRSRVKVVSVVGFPFGDVRAETKAFEAERAVADGADEIDMVMAVGAFLAGEDTLVAADVQAVVRAAGVRVKVIIEAGLLPGPRLEAAAALAVQAGARFVKTSSGYGGSGATVEVVRRLRAAVGPHVGVKASGGVRTAGGALELLRAGANRIGATRGVEIVREALVGTGTS